MARKRIDSAADADSASASAPAFDVNREQEVRNNLKAAQADLQGARERAALPTFVPAESEESKAFRAAQEDVAKFERDKAKAEAEAAVIPAPKFVPDAVEPEPKSE